MPRRKRPPVTTRSEHWLRRVVNEETETLDARVCGAFGWDSRERIEWRSPLVADEFAEYFDQSFLDRLDVASLKVPLEDFWPASGPRWDGLARTASGKVILVEAKAYIEEAVDFGTRGSPPSKAKIVAALSAAKAAFGVPVDAPWEAPFYQYANRLAHLHFLRGLNDQDAYLLFLYFAEAPDVPRPCSTAQWEGAIRLSERALGLGEHQYRPFIRSLIWQVSEA
jgi:hypothetical protein